MTQKLIEIFQQQFNSLPTYLVQTPGRVNLIGEHTDYNDGLVLPMAIDRYIWLAFSPRQDAQVQIHSIEFQETRIFSLNNVQKEQDNNWIEYAKGVAWVLQERYAQLNGFNAVLHGNVPQGAGLSSSAALELTIMRAFVEISNLSWDNSVMAKLAQQAENKWVGVNCGIMDQLVIAAAQKEHALLIDCRDFKTDAIPLPKDISVVIMDTATRRGLVDSAYNERRRQCEEAAKIFNILTLREITDEIWQTQQKKFSQDCLKRTRHVITENQRVLDAVTAMRQNDSATLGELMNASHESLRNDYEVSSPHLDIMVNCARNAVGCYGARMTGAGFGGCAVAIVKEMYADDFVAQVTEQYEIETKTKPTLYVTKAVDGVRIKKLN
jgi:galactokinase